MGLYTQGLLTDANVIVIGQLGWGKSALSKAYAFGQRVFENIDPKGEYGPLIEAMGGVVLRLEPGGAMRLNPLMRIGSRELREGLLEAVTRAMLDRPLTQAEHVSLSGALMEADRLAGDAEVCIPDVLCQLREPTRELATELMVSQARRAPSCAAVRWRSSGCAAARWPACSTGRRPPAAA